MSNADFKNIIKKLRLERDYTQPELAKLLNISKSTVAMWESGERFPSPELCESIADLFNVDMDYLYGRTSIRKKIHFNEDGVEYRPAGVKIPVLGKVAAGIPIEAIENVIDEEEITEDMAKTGDFFGLRIQGDSMEPRICDGDVVIVRQQNDIDSGELAIVYVNGYDATCKRIRKYHDGIELISNNPKYEPTFYSNEQIQSMPVNVIGKVVELRGKF